MTNEELKPDGLESRMVSKIRLPHYTTRDDLAKVLEMIAQSSLVPAVKLAAIQEVLALVERLDD